MMRKGEIGEDGEEREKRLNAKLQLLQSEKNDVSGR